MSRIFGPCVQQGYIVPNVEDAAKHWIDLGIGPFFAGERRTIPGTYYGEEYDLGLRAAFTYSGDQQIELIQPHGSAPSIYKDYIAKVPEGGLQHIAFWDEDPDARARELIEAGHPFEVAQTYNIAAHPGRNQHVYLDSTANPGVMVQLQIRNDFYISLWDKIREAADNWDGSDPFRSVLPLFEELR